MLLSSKLECFFNTWLDQTTHRFFRSPNRSEIISMALSQRRPSSQARAATFQKATPVLDEKHKKKTTGGQVL